MKFDKTIILTAFEVEYIDKRQPKPRIVLWQTVILDGGRLSALERLGLRPAVYISQQFERSGYAVASIRKGETITAQVDLDDLWTKATLQALGVQIIKQGGAQDEPQKEK